MDDFDFESLENDSKSGPEKNNKEDKVMTFLESSKENHGYVLVRQVQMGLCL